MQLKLSISLFLLALLTATTATSEIYKWVDASGNIHFTDKPISGSKQQSGSISTISNPEFNLEKGKMQIRYSDQHGAMMVQGRINGVNLQFIVDTGASFVTIPPAIARRAQLNMKGARLITLQTANGQVEAPLISVLSVEADGVIQQNIQSTVLDLSPDGRTGLLGMSFLSNFHMTIDHERKLIFLEKR